MGLEKKAPKRGGSEGVGYSTLEKNKSNSSLVSSLLRYGLNKLIWFFSDQKFTIV